jgi:hypothetical protein
MVGADDLFDKRAILDEETIYGLYQELGFWIFKGARLVTCEACDR